MVLRLPNRTTEARPRMLLNLKQLPSPFLYESEPESLEDPVFSLGEIKKAFDELLEESRFSQLVEQVLEKGMDTKTLDQRLDSLEQEDSVESEVIKAEGGDGGDLPSAVESGDEDEEDDEDDEEVEKALAYLEDSLLDDDIEKGLGQALSRVKNYVKGKLGGSKSGGGPPRPGLVKKRAKDGHMRWMRSNPNEKKDESGHSESPTEGKSHGGKASSSQPDSPHSKTVQSLNAVLSAHGDKGKIFERKDTFYYSHPGVNGGEPEAIGFSKYKDRALMNLESHLESKASLKKVAEDSLKKNGVEGKIEWVESEDPEKHGLFFDNGEDRILLAKSGGPDTYRQIDSSISGYKDDKDFSDLKKEGGLTGEIRYRKGDHFYYAPNSSVGESLGLDYREGIKKMVERNKKQNEEFTGLLKGEGKVRYKEGSDPKDHGFYLEKDGESTFLGKSHDDVVSRIRLFNGSR